MRLAGFILKTEDANGHQFGCSVAGGRLRGHVDGVLIGGPDGFDYPSLWENKCLGSKFFNLHVEGVGYLNRVRTIKPKKGQEFLACSGAALRGSDSDVCYTKFDCRVGGADAQKVAAFQNPEFYKAQVMRMIVDECHHVGAVSFDAILKRTKAKYVFGLTATPIRRDGQQPIIFMQCGPIRYTAAKPAGAPHDLEVVPRSRFSPIDLSIDAGISDVFRHLANDQGRTEAIAAEVRNAFQQGRRVLVLTERTEHLDAIRVAMAETRLEPFVLHGRMSKKQCAALVTALDALPPDAPRVMLSTGKLVGEGFDHPPLDTLALAMPVSWKGTLQQCAGRLHREHASKTNVRIIDFVDTGHPALLRMWDKRQSGYRAKGYRVGV